MFTFVMSMNNCTYARYYENFLNVVRTSLSLSGVARLAVAGGVAVVVRVGSGPLDVDEVLWPDGELVGNEVVFDSRIDLDDVSSLPADV